MTVMVAERLAIDGGVPAITEPIPSAAGGVGVNAMGEEEISAVTDVLRSGRLFRHIPGSRVAEFERLAAKRLGVPHALMVNSGTSALICALTGLGVGPGDEVIIPAYTYIATAAAVVAAGAVPVIAEIDESLALDPEDVERKITPHTRAIIPVYMQGVPGRIKALMNIARKRGLLCIEDCCQCIGGEYFGGPVGSFGDAAAWSLNYFKILTTGEGGVVFLKHELAYERACFASDPGLPMWLKGSGRSDDWKTPPFSAECYRPSELLGALGVVQLAKLDSILEKMRSLKRAFLAGLDAPRHYRLQHVDDPQGDCGISAAILVTDERAAKRFSAALTAEGLRCGTAHDEGFPDRHIFRYWDSILDKNAPHPPANVWTDPAYRGKVSYSREMCPRTLDLLNRALRFGFNLKMTERHAAQMAKAINKVDRLLD